LKKIVVNTVLVIAIGVAHSGSGQILNRIDSVKLDSIRISHNRFLNNLFQQAINSVKSTPDTSLPLIYLLGKSEDPYMPYQGRIIRHIVVHPLDFNKSFTDTTREKRTRVGDIANSLHTTTRKFIVQQAMFVKENTELNPYNVADNERYLRTLDYIHDARIVVDTLDGEDSVDLIVYTKDLFSLGGGAASDGFNHIVGQATDVNVAGMAQRVDVSGLYDYTRSPNSAFGATYRKDNVLHSFVDASVGYSTISINPFTREEGTTQFVSLSRPLVSPYSHFAGAFTVSRNAGYNSYHIPDSNYFLYKYDLVDIWAGYNVAINALTASNNNIRDRRFFALRYFNRYFSQTPYQAAGFDPIYNTAQAALGQLTFFRQDYFKTQYIYGFGTTEDLPQGYNIAVTGGWYKQLSLERPYGGVTATDYIATPQGDFIQLFGRFGGFLHNNTIQDGSVLIGAQAFSRLCFWNSTKIRQYAMLSFTRLYNRVTYAPLRIDNSFGVRGFLTDSAYGTRRLSVQLETEFYLRYKILGFLFAPFPYCDISLLTPEGQPIGKASLYTSLGGGIRARNENLIFQTIELRAYFFPVAPNNMHGFKIILNGNVRYRYSSNYITAPDVVQLNQ
jgi:hypothetical protein